MPANPKIVREQDPDYLKYIRLQPCIITSQLAEAHHTKSRGSGGSDYGSVPLSRFLHTVCHTMGDKSFQEKYNIDFDKEIIRLLIGFIKILKRREKEIKK